MIVDLLALLLMAMGVFFMLVAAVGFVRFPDVFCRLHVTGVLDTLGAPLVLVGVALYLGITLSSGKLLLAVVFLYATSPLVGHLLARAALEAGYKPVLEEVEDEHGVRHYVASTQKAAEQAMRERYRRGGNEPTGGGER